MQRYFQVGLSQINQFELINQFSNFIFLLQQFKVDVLVKFSSAGGVYLISFWDIEGSPLNQKKKMINK